VRTVKSPDAFSRIFSAFSAGFAAIQSRCLARFRTPERTTITFCTDRRERCPLREQALPVGVDGAGGDRVERRRLPDRGEQVAVEDVPVVGDG
jgi:hypothetical protein